MTSTQKIIKYLAIALAILIIASIVSAVCFAVSAIVGIFDKDDHLIEMHAFNLDKNAIPSELEIDINAAELTIQYGNELRVETNNKHISCTLRNGKLKIEENAPGKIFVSFGGNASSKLSITLPRLAIFDSAEIETGAGKVKIDGLSTKDLDLDLGAGRADIEHLTSSGKASINCGAGKVTVKYSAFNSLELDHGAGELNMTALIQGRGEIDCGVGSVKLTLLGESNYTVYADKGLGSFTVDGKSMSDGDTYGDGNVKIDIDGGLGAIKVDFDEINYGDE